jgi:hypothetical protein
LLHTCATGGGELAGAEVDVGLGAVGESKEWDEPREGGPQGCMNGSTANCVERIREINGLDGPLILGGYAHVVGGQHGFHRMERVRDDLAAASDTNSKLIWSQRLGSFRSEVPRNATSQNTQPNIGHYDGAK